MTLRLSQIRAWLGLPAGSSDAQVRGWSIDSRTIRPGELFFAIRGPRHDGHGFVGDAFARGAAGAVVADAGAGPRAGALVVVPDTVAALQRVAARARNAWGGRVVAVTGSCGKTTTKEAIATLLGQFVTTAKSEGNLNNEFGLPLSLLRIPDRARAAVVEIGINHPGEMGPLARIAAPDVSVVTNVGPAHLGNFASVDEIAWEKGRLVAALSAEGCAVLNADDRRVAAFGRRHKGRSLTFAIEGEADFRAEDVEDRGIEGSRFKLGGLRLSSPLAGRHNVYNVLAAIAAARPFGIAPGDLAGALRRLQPSPMRGVIRKRGGVVLIDDCYNANPDAVRAMLRVLRRTSALRRIAVLGEMRELGARSRELHRQVGRAVASSGIDYLVAVGGDAAEIASSAGIPAEYCASAGEAAAVLQALVRRGDAVLLKGSRGVGLEQARDPLLEMLARSGGGAAERTALRAACCISS